MPIFAASCCWSISATPIAPTCARPICKSISSAIDRLGPAGEAVQPLFITVDPEHDTPETIKLYVALFHPRLIGLTGSASEIKKVALAYKVYYAKTERDEEIRSPDRP